MKIDTSRAWKDKSYFNSLTDLEKSLVPSSPIQELTDLELLLVSGGNGSAADTDADWSNEETDNSNKEP